MEPEHTDSLNEQVGELRARVRRMEEALSRQGILSQEFLDRPLARRQSETPTAATSVSAALAVEQPEAEPAPPITLPSFWHAEQSAADADGSLETRIGSQWFNRAGILAVLIGMAWFLKLAIDNHWIGPLGRVLIGLAAGGALIAWSERFRSRGYFAFSYSLKAVGSGILYLSLWAAFSVVFV